MKTQQGKKYIWKLPLAEQEAALSIAAEYNISVPVVQTLLSRGFTTKEQIDSYLFSSFEKDVAHPSLMKDVDKAVDRIVQAIERKEKILIFGDYDVDGITSSALMMHCLLPLGAQVNFFLPHRVRDGYGLSEKIVKRAAENGYKLIITVDNGITAFKPAERAKELGIDLIITDHHQPHDHLPDAYAVIDPHQKDCAYPYKKFAGVGVSFKIISLLYERKGLQLSEKVYELLLLGTIADVVPLTGENRFWVRYGLHRLNKQESFSFKVLKQNGKVNSPKISSTDIGFGITPQINALGRLEDARQGVKFLIGLDTKEVERVGGVLLELNQTRKEIERSIFSQVIAEVESGRINIAQENSVLAASAEWPPGVIGLVASRVVGAYGKPTILLHLTSNGLAKGSCRSIPEFNMFEALQELSPFLESFGGHAMAAGLALKVENIAPFKEALEKIIAQRLTADDLQQKITLDAEIKLSELTAKCVEDLDYLEPFGNENPQPSFFIKNVSLVKKPQLLKGAHVKCQVFAEGVIKPIIFFNRPDVFDFLIAHETDQFDVAAQINENHWNGRVSIELTGLDIARRAEET